MIQIHADSREQLEQWRAAPFFVPVPDFYDYGHDGDGYAPLHLPDPEWVKAGEPCETCGGHGFVDLARNDGFHHYAPVRRACPDCIGGKPRIAITVPCEMCGGAGYIETHEGNDYCPDCLGGRVVVPDVWAVIGHGPLPIVAKPSDMPDTPCIALLGGGLVMLWHRDSRIHASGASVIRAFRLDPASLVGTFGAICRVVTSC